MKIQKIYLETTVFNYPFADDAPQYQAATLLLLDEIKEGKFKAYTSDYVVQELEHTKDAVKREKMLALITDCNITVLPGNEETKDLADLYISAGIIPQHHDTDALHIAAATVAGLDCVISLNYKHIVKHKTIMETEFINIREGYKRIFIHSPAEIIEDDEKQ